MTQIPLTTTLDEETAVRLTERAHANGHTIEEEAREILRDAVGAPQAEAADDEEDVGLGTLATRRFRDKGIGLEEGDIRELRGPEWSLKPMDVDDEEGR